MAGAKLPPGMDEVIDEPGANSERNEATLAGGETASVFVVALTLIAGEIQAGAVWASRKTLLPAATVVAIPAERKVSMIGLRGSLSHEVENRPLPRLRLTAAKW